MLLTLFIFGYGLVTVWLHLRIMFNRLRAGYTCVTSVTCNFDPQKIITCD